MGISYTQTSENARHSRAIRHVYSITRIAGIDIAQNNHTVHVARQLTSCNLFFGLQIMFFLFIILGALLIVNMLIAMIGNTYLKVAETEKEWTRQVCIMKKTKAWFLSNNFDKVGQITTEKMRIQELRLWRSEWCELDVRVKTSSLSDEWLGLGTLT